MEDTLNPQFLPQRIFCQSKCAFIFYETHLLKIYLRPNKKLFCTNEVNFLNQIKGKSNYFIKLLDYDPYFNWLIYEKGDFEIDTAIKLGFINNKFVLKWLKNLQREFKKFRVIHRDLYEHNMIYFKKDHWIKLIDFQTASIEKEDSHVHRKHRGRTDDFERLFKKYSL